MAANLIPNGNERNKTGMMRSVAVPNNQQQRILSYHRVQYFPKYDVYPED
jgi:hypothetical protein